MPLTFDSRGLPEPGTHDATLAEVEQANGTYFSNRRWAILRFISALGRVSQP